MQDRAAVEKKKVSVDLAGIGPGHEPGDDVELPKEAAHDLVGVSLCTQPIELRHDPRERPLHVADGALRVVLTLLFEAALALHELFAIEGGNGIERRLTGWARIGQEP